MCRAGVCVFAAAVGCLRTMEEAGGEERLNRLLERHGQEVVGFVMFAKAKLSENAYKELVKAAREIVEQRYRRIVYLHSLNHPFCSWLHMFFSSVAVQILKVESQCKNAKKSYLKCLLAKLVS